ncbi:MAG: hypothetical protein FJX11_08485 [Alphaproteobacteria bacterium]|nr:hypothetical protein [Alphaproteobacteria bacterium]
MAKLGGWVAAVTASLALIACTTTGQGGGTAGSGLQPAVAPVGMTVNQGAAYCSRLASLYGEYVGSYGAYLGGDFRGGEAADLDARVAIANCQDGNYAAGIPVLQDKLRDARVTVPPPPAG